MPLTPDQTKRYHLEYQILNNGINARGRQFATVSSIFYSGSFIAFAFLLNASTENGVNPIVFDLSFLFACSAIGLAFFWFWTTRQIDEMYWTRIKKIEKILEIENVHDDIYNEIIETRWYNIRKNIWIISSIVILVLYTVLYLLKRGYI